MSDRVRTPRRTEADRPAVRPQRRSILRPASQRRPLPVPVLKQRGFGLRWLSLLLVLAFVGGGVFLFTDPMFFVNRVEVGGARYVPAEEIFASSGVAGYHILWIDPQVVAERIIQSPSLSSAEVEAQWPARVVIVVREREPALVWQQGDQSYWVDVNGHLMVMRRDLPGLVRVVNESASIPFFCPGPACADDDAISINPAVVRGAQQLKTLRPDLEVLYYDEARGLSFQDERGWRVYVGVGTDMVFKLQVYERLVADLLARGVRLLLIDVSDPAAPYYAEGS